LRTSARIFTLLLLSAGVHLCGRPLGRPLTSISLGSLKNRCMTTWLKINHIASYLHLQLPPLFHVEKKIFFPLSSLYPNIYYTYTCTIIVQSKIPQLFYSEFLCYLFAKHLQHLTSHRRANSIPIPAPSAC